MTLLVRIGFVWIILGLVLGLLLRRLGWRRKVAFGVSFLPWLGHLLYVVAYTLRGADDLSTRLSVFVAVSLVLGVAVGLAAWRYTTGNPKRMPLVPLGLGLVYALPLLWFSSVLQARTLRLDSISVALFVGATLFMSSALLTYTVQRPRGSVLVERRGRGR